MGHDRLAPGEQFSKTDIHRIQMGKRFHCSTKLDRDPAFIEELVELGHERAAAFRVDHPDLA